MGTDAIGEGGWPLPGIGFMAVLPSGLMLSIFTYRAKDRAVLSSWGVIAAIGWLPVITILVLAVSGPPAPTVAAMLDDPTLVECYALRPSYEESRWATAYGAAPGMTADEIRHHAKIVALYLTNCS